MLDRIALRGTAGDCPCRVRPVRFGEAPRGSGAGGGSAFFRPDFIRRLMTSSLSILIYFSAVEAWHYVFNLRRQ